MDAGFFSRQRVCATSLALNLLLGLTAASAAPPRLASTPTYPLRPVGYRVGQPSVAWLGEFRNHWMASAGFAASVSDDPAESPVTEEPRRGNLTITTAPPAREDTASPPPRVTAQPRLLAPPPVIRSQQPVPPTAPAGPPTIVRQAQAEDGKPGSATQTASPVTSESSPAAKGASAPVPAPEPSPADDAASVAQRVKEIQESKDLDQKVKDELLSRLNPALESFKLAADAEAKTNAFRAEAEKAETEAAVLKAELAKPMPEVQRPEITADITLTQIERWVSDQEAKLKAEAEALQAAERDAKTSTERRAEIPKLSKKAEEQLAAVKKELAALPDSGNSEMDRAKRTQLRAQEVLLESQIALYDAELNRHDSLSEVLQLRVDKARRGKPHAEKELAMRQELLAEFREAEAKRQADEARQKVADAHPTLRDFAKRNVELAEERAALLKSLEKTNTNLTNTRATLTDLSEKLADVREKERKAGLTTSIGLLLRNQKTQLPSMRPVEKLRAFIEEEIPRVQLRLMGLKDERGELADTDAVAKSMTEGIDLENLPAAEADHIRATVQEMIAFRRELLQSSVKDNDSYLERLGNLEVATRSLIDKRAEYAAHIDERVLWIRSTSPLSVDAAAPAWQALRQFGLATNWQNLGLAVQAYLWNNPLEGGLIIVALAMVVFYGQTIRRRLRHLTDAVTAEADAGFAATAKALVLAFAGASLWPALLALTAWRLQQAPGLNSFSQAYLAAMLGTSLFFWTVSVFRQLCRPRGVGERHFHWPTEGQRDVHDSLRRLMIVALPLIFFVLWCDATAESEWIVSLGRIAFVGACGMLALTTAKLLSPRRGPVRAALSTNRSGWMHRLRYVWYPLAVFAPVALVALAVLGYYYTAEQLVARLVATMWLSLAILLLQSLASRWLYLTADRLEKKRLAAVAVQALMEPSPAGDVVEEEQIDLLGITRQLQRLKGALSFFSFVVGCWLIWSQVLPALGILNEVKLWDYTAQVAESIDTATGVVSQTRDTLVPVTLGSLLLCLLVFSITIAGTRNLPGLLEVALLKHLPLDSGARHAVTTLCRYVLIVVGFAFGFSFIGVSWQSVQWLAAAMSVGLGFGLQEIFANFVSGLILLFERPVRVGDLVTVGGTTGHVTRMRIRATTITDYDRRELVVPNKKFITDEFVNWTLSDPISRVAFNVGIAYGSDTTKAHEILQRLADEHPLVLRDPAPHVLFQGFGDSTLDFVMRLYLPTRDNYLVVVNEINSSIDREFREHGIEIAFPQRDLHIRSIEGIEELGADILEGPQSRKSA